MAMPVRITAWTRDERLARTACRAAFKRISDLVKIFSDYDPESEVRRLTSMVSENSDHAAPFRMKVSPELFEVIVHAIDMHKRSDGAFDPTAGPIVQLWRQARKDEALPTQDAIASALRRVDITAVEVNEATHEISILRPGVRLDLGAIAKGFIGDEALQTIQSHGVMSACIEAGGDFVLGDPPPGKPGWEIDVPFLGKVVLKNCGVSVSGDTSQFVVIDSVRYSHVVDPRSGMALTNRRMTVVVAPSGMQSDALATTGCIMNAEEFNKMIARIPNTQSWQYTITAENEHLLSDR
jgi:thiamine biosynthesis lipoprotein